MTGNTIWGKNCKSDVFLSNISLKTCFSTGTPVYPSADKLTLARKILPNCKFLNPMVGFCVS